jgi:hypothetical protein
MATIEELLKSMLTLPKDGDTTKNRSLPNTAETWARIGNKDSFSELGFESTNELNEFLKEWTEQNQYGY